MACRFSASDSASRTLRLPSTPLKLETMNASVDQPGPCHTLTALLSTLVLPGGSQNYTNFNNPKITADLENARSTASLNKRAALVADAEKLTMQQLPWIPNVQPTSLLLLGKGLTGAVASFAYMFAPWADSLGGSG